MTPQTTDDKSEILRLLEESRSELHTALAGYPGPGGRVSGTGTMVSAGVPRAVINVEQVFLGRLRDAAQADASTADKQREAMPLARVVDRSNRVQAPELVRPSGRFRSLSDALDSYNAARADTLRFVEENHESIRALYRIGSSAH